MFMELVLMEIICNYLQHTIVSGKYCYNWTKLMNNSILEIEINDEIRKVPLHIRLPFMLEPNLENRLSLIDSDIIYDTPSVIQRIGNSLN